LTPSDKGSDANSPPDRSTFASAVRETAILGVTTALGTNGPNDLIEEGSSEK
jgi:hypothetical protein